MCKKMLLGVCMLLALLMQDKVYAAPREGIYVGAGVGGTFDRTKVYVRNTDNGLNLSRSQNESHALGTVFFGYGASFCDRFFLGLEGGTYFPRRRLRVTYPGVVSTTAQFTHSTKIQDYFTGDILPGFRLCPRILAYLRGGFTICNITGQQDPNLAFASPGFTTSRTKCGGRVGIGFNYGLGKCWAIGLDYFHTFYPRGPTRITGLPVDIYSKSHADYLGVSLIFNFPGVGR